MAVEGDSDSMSSQGSSMSDLVVAWPLGFREVVACLMRDSSSLAPIEAPWRQDHLMLCGAHGGNSVCHPDSTR